MGQAGEAVVARPESWSLSVVLRLERGGPEVTREPVTEAGLIDARSETWLAGVLRRGGAGVALEDVDTRVVPAFTANGKCSGFAMEVVDPAGIPFQRDFTVRSFAAVADKASQRLVAAGRIKADDLYYYEILAEPAATDDTATFAEPTFTVRTRPIVAVPVSINRLLEQARHVGPAEGQDFCPVFYTAEALEQAETCSRRGARCPKPVESGGLLVGVLGTDPETGEMCVIVFEVLEAKDAEESEFALRYSGKTWAHIQTLMNARQSQPETAGHRLVGQCHGHNFLPGNDGTACEDCPRLAECQSSTAFVSEADQNWALACFRRQPWQLNFIFGLNARREHVHKLYGLRDGRLTERGFHVIAEFDPNA